MTEIIFVRHAEAEGNALRIFHGQYNSRLTEKGHIQADRTGRYLADVKIDKIYTSDLTRTYMTALHIAAYQGCEVVKNVGLREIAAGDWENRYFEELQNTYKEEFAVWQDNTGSFSFPNGESVKEMTKRVGETIDKIALQNDGKRIVIVSHATPIRCIKCYYNELTFSEMKSHGWPTNAAVSRGIYENGSFSFLTYGEDAFLQNI